jgi:small-conductance mechanosensitive channel
MMSKDPSARSPQSILRVSHIIVVMILVASIACGLSSFAQPQTQTQPQPEAPAAVVHNGQRLFVYYSTLEGLTPADRARRTALIIQQLSDLPRFDPAKISLKETPEGTSVCYGDTVIATATIGDAEIAKDSTTHMAGQYVALLKNVLVKRVEEVSAGKMAMGVGICAVVVLLLLLTVVLICRTASSCCERIKRRKDTAITGIKIQKAELLSAEILTNLLISVVQFVQFLLIIISSYAALLVCLDSFPSTKELAQSIRDTSVAPVVLLVGSAVNYLPHLLALAVIGLVAYGVMAFARVFFDAIEAGSIEFAGFDRDWAQPTFKLVRLLIFDIALVVALPYFPGWHSEAFKQVGLLFGLLVSLGSSQVVGHMMGGTVLTYTNAFKTGDRVKIGAHVGDVLEKTLFVTRLVTTKNEVISIPNGQVLSSDIINYSNMAKQGELVLYTSVTIGYDVDWRTVRDLLLKAALDTTGVVTDPPPFVLATTLGDFAVTYELNARTDDASRIERSYSELNQSILDRFNSAGVEIMSPHVYGLRDSNAAKLPLKNLPEGYRAPLFRTSVVEEG